jgi:6-phosphogluconolactonase (cycloisomerase 2 family)
VSADLAVYGRYLYVAGMDGYNSFMRVIKLGPDGSVITTNSNGEFSFDLPRIFAVNSALHYVYICDDPNDLFAHKIDRDGRIERSSRKVLTFRLSVEQSVSGTVFDHSGRTVYMSYAWQSLMEEPPGHLNDEPPDPSPTPITIYHICKDGHFRLVTARGSLPAIEPFPVIDKSGKYLFVFGRYTIDTYAVKSDGTLRHLQRIKHIRFPENVTFVNQ